MARIVSKAFQLRLDYQKKLGRTVPLSEVSRETGLARNAISRLEENKTERYDADVLTKLCQFYGVEVGDILEFRPEDRRVPELGFAVNVAF